MNAIALTPGGSLMGHAVAVGRLRPSSSSGRRRNGLIIPTSSADISGFAIAEADANRDLTNEHFSRRPPAYLLRDDFDG